MNTNQGASLASPTMGGALPAGCVPLWVVSTQQVGSLRSSSSYQSSSSDSSSLLLTSVLDFFLDSSPSLSFSSSPSGDPLPVSPGLLLIVDLLAGTDFWLGLALLLDDLLEELPELEPSFLLESAQVIILSLFRLTWLVISFSELRLRKQYPPATTAATNAKAIMMFRGVKTFLLGICLAWVISTSVSQGSCSIVQPSRRGSDTDCGCTANIIQNNYILVASLNGLNNQTLRIELRSSSQPIKIETSIY